jgi:hypothetical protein
MSGRVTEVLHAEGGELESHLLIASAPLSRRAWNPVQFTFHIEPAGESGWPYYRARTPVST